MRKADTTVVDAKLLTAVTEREALCHALVKDATPERLTALCNVTMKIALLNFERDEAIRDCFYR